MAVCAVAPAMEPARNLLCVSIFLPSEDNNFLNYIKTHTNREKMHYAHIPNRCHFGIPLNV